MTKDWLRISRPTAWVVGVAIFLALSLWVWTVNFPPLPRRISVEITFPHGAAGTSEPLVTTGEYGDGDFLAVQYQDAETAILLYDVWGVGGPKSVSFPLRPGVRQTLEIEMPTLAHVTHVASHEKRLLRVALDGQVLLEGDVYFHRRAQHQIYFATNPIGGELVRERFTGQLTRPDGRALKGGPAAWFGFFEHLAWVLRNQWPAVGANLLLAWAGGLIGGWLLPRAARFGRPPGIEDETSAHFPPVADASHRWFIVTATLCSVAFAYVITDGTWQFIFPESFGEQYDYQAQSLLKGRLDLPAEAKSWESFVFEGRNYIYFGPTPALLRMPFVACGVAFGQLSRSAMLVYYVALLWGLYVLMLHVARLARGPGARPKPVAVVLLIGSTGLGSTLFFVASRAYVYHEAILCGAMFALWSGYCSLRYLAEPRRAWWLGAILCGLLSIHARPTSGLFALATAGCAAIFVGGYQLWNRAPAERGFASIVRTLRKSLLIGCLATLAILSFNGVSYLKFRSFEGAPLKYHVQYDANRLAVIRGKNFHVENLRHNFDAYVWRPDFVWRRTFPYFYIQRGDEPSHYRFTRRDLVEPTLAMPYAMPALFLLATVGGLFALIHWPVARGPLAIVAGGAVPMTLALFTAVAISHRYTGDFCPALLLVGAFGLQALELLTPRLQRLTYALLAVLALWSIFVTVAATLHYQGDVVWGVPDEVKAHYESLRKTVDRILGLGAK